MENTETILSLDQIKMSTEPAVSEAGLAPARAEFGIAARLRTWFGCAVQLRTEQSAAPIVKNGDAGDVDDDWEKWVHSCGRAVR
jgi:hypothetical protein